MKRVTANIIVISIVLGMLVLSCYSTISSDNTGEIDLDAISHTTEQYFEGNLSYSSDNSFFEESISGAIIPVDMTGMNFMIDTEFPHLNEKQGEPIHIKLTGYLAPQPNSDGITEVHLTIRNIKEVHNSKCHIDPMVGTYNGDGHTLVISSDRTYTLQSKNGEEKQGNWFLHSKNTMILLSENSKTAMRVNYKKKSLNGKDDHPTIFTLVSSLSNH